LHTELSARQLLYVVIGGLWLICLAILLTTGYSVIEGLFTEATGVVVSVFLIDLLLRAERKERLKRANEINTKSVDIFVAIAAARIGGLVGLKDVFSFDDLTDEQYKTKIKEITQSKEWSSYMAQYGTLNKRIIKLVKQAQPVIEQNRKMISEAMHKMYPAPNPSIIEKVDQIHLEMRGMLEARQFMVEAILVKVPKEFNGFKDQSEKDKKIWKEGTEVMWAKVINGEDRGTLGSIEGHFKALLNDYTFIKEQAQKNNLYFDV
jgi:hypothetical protein